MPEEFGRTTARKRIILPGGAPTSNYVDLKVITKISWIDASDRYQETQHSIDNSSESARQVHVDRVYPTDVDGNQNTSIFLEVERIDVWPLLDPTDRYQETQTRIDNVTGADSAPPHFSNHLQTHVVRCYQDPNNPDDNSPWIDTELIDRFSFIDASDRYQELQYTLNQPAADDPLAQANPSDPEISDSANGIDPAWRTDPFQNIINWSAGIRAPYNPPFTLVSASVGVNSSPGNPIVPVTVLIGNMLIEGQSTIIAGSFAGTPPGPGTINIGAGNHGCSVQQDAQTGSTQLVHVFTSDDATNAAVPLPDISLDWSAIVFTPTDTTHYPNTTWIPNTYAWVEAPTGSISAAGLIHLKPTFPPQHWEFNTLTQQWEIKPGL